MPFKTPLPYFVLKRYSIVKVKLNTVPLSNIVSDIINDKAFLKLSILSATNRFTLVQIHPVTIQVTGHIHPKEGTFQKLAQIVFLESFLLVSHLIICNLNFIIYEIIYTMAQKSLDSWLK